MSKKTKCIKCGKLVNYRDLHINASIKTMHECLYDNTDDLCCTCLFRLVAETINKNKDASYEIQHLDDVI